MRHFASKAQSSTPSNSPNATEWVIAILLAANLAWTSLCLGGVRAETMTWSWGFTGATLVVVVLQMAWKKQARGHWAPLCLLPFVLYAGASVQFITPVPWLGARDFWHWMQMLLTFFIAINGLHLTGPRRLVLATITLLGAAGLLFSAYQLNGHEMWLMLGRTQAAQYVGRASGFFGNPNSLAALFVLTIPPTLSCAWRCGASGAQRVACGYAAIALIVGLALTMSRGGLLAFALAMICWPLFVREWHWKKRALACGAVIAAVAISAGALGITMPSLRERAQDLAQHHAEKSRPILWNASLKMTASAPLFGTGAGSFNTVFEKYRPEGFRDEPQWTHNEFLNTLSDYGALGFVLLFGAIGAIACRCNRGRVKIAQRAMSDELLAHSAFARAQGIGLLGFAFACTVDFHLKIPALGMIVAVYAAEIVKRREVILQLERKLAGVPAWIAKEPPAPPPTRSRGVDARLSQTRRIISSGLLIIIVSIVTCHVTNAYRAEASRALGREIIDSLANLDLQTVSSRTTYLLKLTHAEALFSDALKRNSKNAQTWSDHAYALALEARVRPEHIAALGRRSAISAREALARSEMPLEFWLRLGVALDLQGRSTEAGSAFAHALTLAPASALAWYHQAYHLSLMPATRALARSAADICLRLDPGYANADTLRVRLETNR